MVCICQIIFVSLRTFCEQKKKKQGMGLFFKRQNNNIIEEVKDFLVNELFVSKVAYSRGEANVEDKLLAQLKEKFGDYPVTNQCRVGDKLKLKCDFDLFNKQCGIELKLAHSLESNAGEFQRAIGQIACYAHEDYKDTGVILLVVGDGEISDKIKELQAIVKIFQNVHFVYKQAQYKR